MFFLMTTEFGEIARRKDAKSGSFRIYIPFQNDEAVGAWSTTKYIDKFEIGRKKEKGNENVVTLVKKHELSIMNFFSQNLE